MELETLIIFATSFIFSLLCLVDLKHAIDHKTAPALGLITGLFSTALWFIFGYLWIGSASLEMYVALGWLWIVFGFSFLVITIACIGFLLKYTVSGEQQPLRIERVE